VKRYELTILSSFLVVLLSACATKEEVVYSPVNTHAPIHIEKTGEIFANAKTMQFPTLKNKIITIKGEDNLLKVTNPEYQNKEVLLYLFGRDCPHCVREVPQIKALAKKSNLKIIGIHAHKMIGDRTLKAYAKKVGYNFDILSFKNDIIMIRYLKKSGLWYGGTPTHLLIDAGGNVHELSIQEILNR